MKKYLLFVCIIATLLSACRTPRRAVEREMYTRIDTTIIIRERLVPVQTPTDSAQMKALLECDSTGEVILNALYIEQSKNATLNVELDKMGRMMASFRTITDTIYIPVRDTARTIKSDFQEKEKGIVEVEVERKRRVIESYMLVCGVLLNLLFVLGAILFISYYILKRKLS